MDPEAVSVERVPVEVTLPLRNVILRPGRDPAMPGDDDPATVHLAARDDDGAVVGVVRIHPEPCPWRPDSASPWQLRGMATDPAVRGSGAGRALVEAAIAHVEQHGGDLIWCDARTSAAWFYVRMGFEIVTDEFDKPGVGPHVGMLRALAAAPGLDVAHRRDAYRGGRAR